MGEVMWSNKLQVPTGCPGGLWWRSSVPCAPSVLASRQTPICSGAAHVRYVGSARCILGFWFISVCRYHAQSTGQMSRADSSALSCPATFMPTKPTVSLLVAPSCEWLAWWLRSHFLQPDSSHGGVGPGVSLTWIPARLGCYLPHSVRSLVLLCPFFPAAYKQSGESCLPNFYQVIDEMTFPRWK